MKKDSEYEKILEELKGIGLKVFELDNERNKVIEKKAEILLSVLLIIIPSLVGLFYYLYIDRNFKSLVVLIKIFFVFSIFSFFVSAVFSIIAISLRTFKSIDFKKIWDNEKNNLKEINTSEVKYKFLDHLCKIHNKNKIVIDGKAKNLLISFIFTGLFFIVIFFIHFIFYLGG